MPNCYCEWNDVDFVVTVATSGNGDPGVIEARPASGMQAPNMYANVSFLPAAIDPDSPLSPRLVKLHKLKVVPSGAGWGHPFLDYVIDLVGQFCGTTISTEPSPDPDLEDGRDTALSPEKLRDFYGRHGFKDVPGSSEMRR